jgi:hypothetical protein
MHYQTRRKTIHFSSKKNVDPCIPNKKVIRKESEEKERDSDDEENKEDSSFGFETKSSSWETNPASSVNDL